MTGALFTFAVVADTHLNPRDGESGSPWKSNALANARARRIVAALNDDAPDFVLHLGDMVHPVPAQVAFPDAVARFKEIFGALEPPLHRLPGNHDIGDKPGDWMPAHPVTPKALDGYRAAFGPLWRTVDHRGCRFIMHCSPILGSGLPEDAEQEAWLKEQLAGAEGRRIFFFTHYPLYLTDPLEPEHYDNLAGPARERLRRLLLDHGVEAVFAAHVHTIFHTRLAPDGPFQHVVPAVSALRPDYANLFAAPPEPGHENGRNDAAKLGHYLIEIRETGYRIRFRRSYGAVSDGDGGGAFPAPAGCYDEPLASRPIGVDLRHGWAQPRAIPYSGVVDEFRRKYTRNDYLLTALQESGLRDLRAPLDDLLDPATQERMREFAAFGHRFRLFTLEPPDPQATRALRDSGGIVASLEVIARDARLPGLVREWRDAAPGAPLFAAPMWTSSDLPPGAVRFAHAIGHGFHPRQFDTMREAAALADGVTVRIGPLDDPAEVMEASPASPAATMFYLTLAGPDPAAAADDDAAQAERVMAALAALPRGAALMLDTFEDHDRGYYPRHGLYDARFNPRALALRLSTTEFGPDSLI